MIAFTICSNNYLAHAKTLGDSFLAFHPQATFIIGLADKYDENFDYQIFKDFNIIPIEDLKIPNLEELYERYNITEFNTAIKPSFFHHLFKKNKQEKILYIDPDILITSPLEEVLRLLDEKNIIITPHILTPIDDEFAPTDYQTLRGGVFNLGFIALSNYDKVKRFLDWWHARVIKYGFCNFGKNMFYDQLWINYVPCFFDNYYILKHPGYNMANWNLHERNLGTKSGAFEVNNKYPLRFFHFSSYKFDKPEVICSYLTRYNFESRPDLKPLFEQYYHLLSTNNIKVISKLSVHNFPMIQKSSQKKTLFERIVNRFNGSIKYFFKGHV